MLVKCIEPSKGNGFCFFVFQENIFFELGKMKSKNRKIDELQILFNKNVFKVKLIYLQQLFGGKKIRRMNCNMLLNIFIQDS